MGRLDEAAAFCSSKEEKMKYFRHRKSNIRRASVGIAAGIVLVGAVLSLLMYGMIQNSFFQAATSHEMELMRIMQGLGSELMDARLRDLKENARETARQYGKKLANSDGAETEEILSDIGLQEHRLNYCYRTKNASYAGRQFSGDYAAGLDISRVWKGETVLFDPDFDAEGNYILVVAAPVWEDDSHSVVKGVLLEQLDGYCISQWLAKLFLDLDVGTAYLVNSQDRNIATVWEENYDWITSRYNAAEIAVRTGDTESISIARLEQRALSGERGTGSYTWEGGTSYVAYGPLTEADWAIFVGFYGDKFSSYTRYIASISSRAAGLMLTAFSLFLGGIIAFVMHNLHRERQYSEALMQQKDEIEQQAMQIAVSEERFRIAMQRIRDIILEYQLETDEIICFYSGREIKSGRLGSDRMRSRMIEKYGMTPDSVKKFEEVMKAMRTGIISAECTIEGVWQGERKYYNMSVSAIPGSFGKPERAVGILRDVTGEHEAELDSLTRLLNKNAMTDYVKKAMAASQPGETGSFVMLDVDCFKLVNDRYGHPVGDQVLYMVASLLQEIFPTPYLTGRFGGDEFSVYGSPDEKEGELKRRLELLLTRVKKLRVAGCDDLRISLSIGAVLFQGGTDFADVYEKADALLYEVKKSGRDGFRIKDC